MMTRHSTMIVGPTGGGKSVVIQTLAQAQTALGLPTKMFTLNPKVSTNNLLCTVHYVSCAGKRPHKLNLYVLVMEIFKSYNLFKVPTNNVFCKKGRKIVYFNLFVL